MYNCIIFDVDGTLTDTEKAVFATYQKVIHGEFGRYFTPEEIQPAYGIPTPVAFRKLGFNNIEESCKIYHEYLMEAYCDVRPFQGITEVLEYLKKNNITTGIVTSRNGREVAEDICLQRLVHYFDFIICSDDTKRHKPDPEPLQKIMEIANSDISKTLYIGDTHYDYMCAKNAGVPFALALWGAKTTENIYPDYSFKQPEELLDIIKGSLTQNVKPDNLPKLTRIIAN